jgi:hypothetical protein
MSTAFSASDVLGAMITPAVLISASGTLVLSTSNRLTRWQYPGHPEPPARAAPAGWRRSS